MHRIFNRKGLSHPSYIVEKPWRKLYPLGYSGEVEVPRKSVTDLFDEATDRFASSTALVFYGFRLSYQHLREAVDRFATALHELGVQKGERVAILLPNCPQFVIVYYGALKAGATVTAMSPLLTAKEIAFQLRDAGARLLVTLDLFFTNVEAAWKETQLDMVIVTRISEYLPVAKRILGRLVGKVKTARVAEKSGVLFLADLLGWYPRHPPKIDFEPERDVASIPYTGGTTGTPKGVMLTHHNLVANTTQMLSWVPLEEGKETALAVLPFFHAYGQVVIMNAGLIRGESLVVFPRFELDEVLKAVARYRVTLFFGVPAIYNALVHHARIKSYDLSSLKYCLCGADILHEETRKKVQELLPAKLIEGYGLTETSPLTHANLFTGGRPGSIGLPVQSTNAAIMDPESCRLLPIGETGEIIINGPQVMSGYWNRPDETRQAFVEIDGEKWLRTGDIGRMDAEGYFYFVERRKDLIKYKGYSVFPKEVEDVLYAHPAVREVCVIGLPDPSVGETIRAVIVLRDEFKDKISGQDIIEWSKDKMAAYKYPRSVSFRDELPKTLVGKVFRRKIREEELQRTVADV